jgi:bifunctional DNase/RNase
MSPLQRIAGVAGLAWLLTGNFGYRTSGAEDAGPEGKFDKPGMVRVDVKSVWRSPDPCLNAGCVFLKDPKTQRLLPVWIGRFEADAIQMKLNGETFPRPLTHDLLKSLLDAAGTKVRYVLVDALRATGRRDSGTYFAKIALSLKGGGPVEVDSRTSDAIALSVRTGAPVYVAAGIMEGNSIADEKELEGELAGEAAKTPKPSGRPEKKEKKAGKDYY